MKNVILLAVVIALFPITVSAKNGGGGTHFDENAPYDWPATKNPGTPKWLTGIKKEKLNDKMITLTWADSNRAHDVEIMINGKTKKSADDSRQKIKNLKNGKVYTFKVRGVSNCGKSGWSKSYKALP